MSVMNRMDYETWERHAIEDGVLVRITGGHTPDWPRGENRTVVEFDRKDADLVRELRRKAAPAVLAHLGL